MSPPVPFGSAAAARAALQRVLDVQRIKRLVAGPGKKGRGRPSEMKGHKLAVCMMVVDELPTEQVWRAWYEVSEVGVTT